jgi:hypothetical protein
MTYRFTSAANRAAMLFHDFRSESFTQFADEILIVSIMDLRRDPKRLDNVQLGTRATDTWKLMRVAFLGCE